MTCIVAAAHPWYRDIPTRLAALTGEEFLLMTRPEELTPEALAAISPEYIFFPHWSHLLAREIYEQYECVMFHMTDLPFGRGGSPLQNLVARGIYDTKISAFRCADGVDTGPIYLKRPFSLHGNAEDIYIRAAAVMTEMAAWIVAHRPGPVPQEGEPVTFPRRRPADGDIAPLAELRQVYDYIRMLDADGYPPAFLETANFRLEFRRAALKQDGIHADVIIKRKS